MYIHISVPSMRRVQLWHIRDVLVTMSSQRELPPRKMECSADGKLIFLVSKWKELYDKNHERFKDTEWKDGIWREICEELPIVVDDVELVKKRWKNLRDTYLKRKKESLKNGTENRNPLREWKHLNSMGFLDPYLRYLYYVPKDTGVYSVSVGEDAVEVYCEMEEEQASTSDGVNTKESLPLSTGTSVSTPHTSRNETPVIPTNSILCMKRKASDTFSEETPKHLNHKMSPKQPKETPDELFVLSLVPALERMSHQQNALARMRIQQVLYDIEFGQGITNG
ncbi:hypothetical protein HOLleu_13071 [Holothuria leucospilota]|uniref:MADF domain-containing protein n=1 Tax=Holothuria leucospilota TaxID=206669 RepID=A0A9Q1HDF0_HOLLE|nr:hypothetical protein HOLleu_13071 [Holothuria leucospilota]